MKPNIAIKIRKLDRSAQHWNGGSRALMPEALESRLMLRGGIDPPASDGGYPADAVSDFALLDVNPTSATYNQAVSPRDYLESVSAWYFGHAT